MSNKKELAVAALRCGTVIDHIPSSVVFDVVKLLDIEHSNTAVTIGNNLSSAKLGTKGIVKVADTFYPTEVLNRIALIAPGAKVNIIRDFEVVEKHPVELPSELVGIVKCHNPKCISNNEPMATRFHVVEPGDGESSATITLRCHYCNREITGNKVQIL